MPRIIAADYLRLRHELAMCCAERRAQAHAVLSTRSEHKRDAGSAAPRARDSEPAGRPRRSAVRLSSTSNSSLLLDRSWEVSLAELTGGDMSGVLRVPTPAAFAINTALTYRRRHVARHDQMD